MEVDLQAIADRLHLTFRQWAREDVEEAVGDAYIEICELAAREPLEKPPEALVAQRARWRMLDRAGARPEGSIDELEEQGIALGSETPLEAHIELAELDDCEIGQRLKAIASAGGVPIIMPRGRARNNAKYTDEEIEVVHRLLVEDHSYEEISRRTGISTTAVGKLVHREVRLTESQDGWSADLVVVAFRSFERRHGRPPRARPEDLNDRLMPCYQTVLRYFPGWGEALEAAGFERRLKARDRESVIRDCCEFHSRTGRWPKYDDFRHDNSLPNPNTVRRYLGTTSAVKIQQICHSERS